MVGGSVVADVVGAIVLPFDVVGDILVTTDDVDGMGVVKTGINTASCDHCDSSNILLTCRILNN